VSAVMPAIIKFHVPHAARDACIALRCSSRENSKQRNPVSVSARGKCTIIGCNCKLLMCYLVGRPNSFRSSCLAAFNTLFRSGLKFRPPRFISKFSIDMAERDGVDLRRELRSAEVFKERASARGLVSLKTPDFRSSALLVLVTRDDHRLVFGRARG